MKLLLVDPLGDVESTGLNIGIAYCTTGAMGRGHTVSVLDLVNIRRPDTSASIRKAIEQFGPDVIGFSVCNMSFKNTEAYVDGIRKYFSGLIIIGGPEISVLGERSLEMMKNVDMAVIGEGEITLAELLDTIEKRADLGQVRGLIWKRGANIVVNAPRDFIKDLDFVPFPDYSVFGVDKMDVYPIVTTRGCPHGCVFCFSYLGKKWRARSPENVIEELKIAKRRYGAKLFFVCDPSFNIDINRVERFCKLLIDEKIDMPWVIQGFRADRVTEDMMQSLKRANCKRIFVGVETLDEDVFKKINKGETLADIKKSIALMKKYNIEIYGYMLMGLPGDTFKKTIRSFEQAQKLDLDVLAYASCVPFTGTGIEKWAKEEAIMLADSYNISSLGTQYGCIAFHTKDFTVEERVKARRILNIKSGGYNEPGAHPLIYRLKKLFFILRYDFKNLPKRLQRSIKYRLNYKKSVDSINLWRGVCFARIPDGTWGISKGEQIDLSSSRRFLLDMKRLSMSETEVRPVK